MKTEKKDTDIRINDCSFGNCVVLRHGRVSAISDFQYVNEVEKRLFREKCHVCGNDDAFCFSVKEQVLNVYYFVVSKPLTIVDVHESLAFYIDKPVQDKFFDLKFKL